MLLRNLLKIEIRLVNNISKTSLSRPFVRENHASETKLVGGESCPDVFGTLDRDLELAKEIDSIKEDSDKIEVNYIAGIRGKTRLSTKQYADMIKKCLSEKKINEAVAVLEEKMLKEHKAKPENYIYNLVIAGCAEVGHTKKAFSLFNEMKKRGLKVTGGTYTSLFNACANSPWPEDGIKRALHLRELMLQKGYTPNQTNYHAMIKAFGHCGDVTTAFSLVDEMSSNGIPPSSDTFNFLLQACASDRKGGFRHALLVWRKLREKKLRPNIYTYNLLLRCARDCGIENMSKEDLEQIASPHAAKKKLLNAGNEETKSTDMTLPSILSSQPNLGSLVEVGGNSKPKHRLMMLGGYEGLMKQMVVDGIKPDIKTMTQLLEIIPSTSIAENTLLSSLELFKVPLDIDFCNMLIKKRCMRQQYAEAKEVLNLISAKGLTPDIVTFGVLGLSCTSRSDVYQLLTDLNKSGYRLNIEVLGALLRAATRIWDVTLVMKLMEVCDREELRPNAVFLSRLEKFRDSVNEQLSIKEKGGWVPKKFIQNSFLDNFKEFCWKHDSWHPVIDTSATEHPWRQFAKHR